MKTRVLKRLGKKPIVPAILASLMLTAGTNISAASPTTMNDMSTTTTNSTNSSSKEMMPPNGQNMPPMLPNGEMPGKGGMGMPPGQAPGQNINNSANFKATKVISNASTTLTNKNYVTTASDQNALLIKNKSNVTINKLDIEKSGDTTSGDGSNFYGQNAGLLALSQSKVNINDIKISTNSEGSNGIFASGDNTVITANNVSINTTKNSSRGLDATYNGTIIAKNVSISTQGDHCASLATDRGEGTVNVTKGNLKTAGDGSPVIYSTGNISVTDVTGSATGSEIACVEGKNNITITNSNLTGYKKHGVMLYQSFSGDADSGTAKFTSKNSTLTSHADGSMFYITNTQAEINLTNTVINSDNNTLLEAAADHWGNEGSNGGHITVNTNNQKLTGSIIADKISTVAVNLKNNSVLSGAINPKNIDTTINLDLDNTSTWEVTADSYINEIKDAAVNYSNIHSNGHNVYYVTNDANASSQLLIGGGHLIPIHHNGNN